MADCHRTLPLDTTNDKPIVLKYFPITEITPLIFEQNYQYQQPNSDTLTPNSPKYLEWNLAEEKLGGIFYFHIRNFKLWKMPKLLNYKFPERWYFLNWDNTELKRSSKNKFFWSRTASLGDGKLRPKLGTNYAENRYRKAKSGEGQSESDNLNESQWIFTES